MAEYKVNAVFTINISTVVDTDDINFRDGEDIEDAVRREAVSQIFDGEYETGDPVNVPKINWVEEQESV